MGELVNVEMTDCGPNKNYQPGQVVEVDEQRARHLVACGSGEYLEATANTGAVESASDRKSVKRSDKKRVM